MNGISGILPAASAPATDHPAAIRDAAEKFEALLVGQLLRSVREAGGENWTGAEDKASESLMEMAEQQLAQVLASRGGMGLGRLIARDLGTRVAQPATAPERIVEK